jgi:hypothetical protein
MGGAELSDDRQSNGGRNMTNDEVNKLVGAVIALDEMGKAGDPKQIERLRAILDAMMDTVPGPLRLKVLIAYKLRTGEPFFGLMTTDPERTGELHSAAAELGARFIEDGSWGPGISAFTIARPKEH